MAPKLYKTIIPLSILVTIALNCSATTSTANSEDIDSSKLPKNHKSYSPEEELGERISSDNNESGKFRTSRQYDSSSMSVHASSNLDNGLSYNSNPSTSMQSGYESQHTSSSTPSTSAASAANLINSITSGSADLSSLTGALANGALWPNHQKQQLHHPSHQYYDQILSPSYPAMPSYPYVPPIASHRQWPPAHGGHGHNVGYPYGSGPYGAAHYPNSLLHNAFNGPISSMFASGTNLLTPLMSKALDLPEILCNAIALAIGTIIIGAPFILIYLAISSHMNGSGVGPGGLGNLFGNLGSMGAGGMGGHGNGGSTIALTGPNSQNQNNGRRKRQVNDYSRSKKETLRRQLSLLSDPQKLELVLKSLIESISKYDNKF